MMPIPIAKSGDNLEDLFLKKDSADTDHIRELLNRYVGASLIFGFTLMLLID